jgi:hypothetical protein
MKLTMRDLVGSVLYLATGAVYWMFLAGPGVGFVDTEREMSALGLVAGAAAFLTLHLADSVDATRTTERWLSGASLVLGVIALLVAGTTSAGVWLAVFMASLAVVWLIEIADHVGAFPHPAAMPPLRGSH